jgi:hypothetical protein
MHCLFELLQVLGAVAGAALQVLLMQLLQCRSASLRCILQQQKFDSHMPFCVCCTAGSWCCGWCSPAGAAHAMHLLRHHVRPILPHPYAGGLLLLLLLLLLAWLRYVCLNACTCTQQEVFGTVHDDMSK